MLSRISVFMLMTMGLILLVFLTDVRGENLIKYAEDRYGIVSYYDKDSIKRKSQILKVWNEKRFTEKNKQWSDFVGFCKKKGVEHSSNTSATNDCNRLSVIKVLTEINCKKGTYRGLSYNYDEDRKVLLSVSTPTDWYNIAPGSIVEELKNCVCK